MAPRLGVSERLRDLVDGSGGILYGRWLVMGRLRDANYKRSNGPLGLGLGNLTV